MTNKDKLLEILAARELERMLAVAGRVRADWTAVSTDVILNSREPGTAQGLLIG